MNLEQYANGDWPALPPIDRLLNRVHCSDALSYLKMLPSNFVNGICASATRPGIVLDPFMGSGTTGLVAQKLNRQYMGCDLNPDYVELATMRLAGRIDEYTAMKSGQPYTSYMFVD